MTSHDELQLLRRVADRDRSAFEELYYLYHRRVFGFLMRIVRRPEVAEEVLNDVMLVVWQSAGGFRERSRVSTWILGIAYRKGLKAVRKLSTAPHEVEVDPGMASDGDGPEERVEQGERRRLILEALEKLSPEHRAAMHLTFYLGYSYKEIAAVAGCPENTVKTRMFHARRRLRHALARLREQAPRNRLGARGR